MASVTMDMSSFAVERETAECVEYGDEVLNAGWIPALPQLVCGGECPMALPQSLVGADIDAFLKRMYACQR